MRKPTEAERGHVMDVVTELRSIQRSLTHTPYPEGRAIVAALERIEALVTDEFGELLASCAHCEAPIFDADDDAVSGDEWMCGMCYAQYREACDEAAS